MSWSLLSLALVHVEGVRPLLGETIGVFAATPASWVQWLPLAEAPLHLLHGHIFTESPGSISADADVAVFLPWCLFSQCHLLRELHFSVQGIKSTFHAYHGVLQCGDRRKSAGTLS